MKPHKHAKLIHAWANGAEIEHKDYGGCWHVINSPIWHDSTEYRIKPEPKPDVVDGIYIGVNFQDSIEVPKINWATQGNANVKLIWDGETGELKSAEVV
jgi:hypothetical protein